MKDSFLLYTEQEELINKLTDEQAGKLIKAIYHYAKTGEVLKMDLTLDIAFTPIKQSLDKNAEKYERIVQRNKANISKRWNNTKNTSGKNGIRKNTKNTDNDNDNDNDNEDDSKKKNIKEKIHFAEFVSMTNAEHEKLISTYGTDFTDQCIRVLDNYKGASGKTYKNDYRAILNWVVDRVKQDNTRNSGLTKAEEEFLNG